MDIASYKVNIRFDIARKEWTRLNTQLKLLDRRLSRFNTDLTKKLAINFGRFNVDQRRLNASLGAALDIASRTTVFSIERFNVDQQNLNRALSRAYARASVVASRSTRIDHGVGDVSGRGLSGRHVAGAGAVGGLAARAYLPALALAGGGYGLGLTNRRNQEVVSAQLQSQAVVQQAGGTAEQGIASFEYLRSEGERIGFNYLDSSNDYNNLISGLTGAGISVGQSQSVYSGFAELARVNKLDPQRQQRVFRALSQVAGKDQLYSEELKQQLAESLPGAVALFAEAYQAQLASQGKGGGLTGSAAIKQLNEAMEKGTIKADILTFAGARASERASTGLSAASRASQAEQARFQNQYNDLAIVASNSGLESGFARLFRSLNAGLEQSNGGVESLARGFDNVSKYISSVILGAQSIQRFFDGKDSYLGDKFFPNEEDRIAAYKFLNTFKETTSEIKDLVGNIYSGWKQIINLIDGSEGLKNITGALDTLGNGIGAINKLAEGDYAGAQQAAKDFGIGAANTVTAPGRYGANAVLGAVGSDFRFGTFGETQTSQIAEYKAEQARLAQQNFNQLSHPGINNPLAPGERANNTVNITANITTNGITDLESQIEQVMDRAVRRTILNFPEGE